MTEPVEFRPGRQLVDPESPRVTEIIMPDSSDGEQVTAPTLKPDAITEGTEPPPSEWASDRNKL